MPGLLFTLTGHDDLSDVMDDIGDAARRLSRRLLVASIEGDRAIRSFSRTTSDRMAALRRDTDAGSKSLEELGKVTKMLWPAAIPAAASLAPIAAGAGTVAVAAAAMTAAIVPQISALNEATAAQQAHEDAVAKNGAASAQAAQAEADYLQTMAALPPKTREAAIAVGMLKDNAKAWSDSLAGDTMAPFIKGVAILDTLLPKTSGLVKAASGETDRFLTVLGGEMAAPGLDRLNSKFTTFAQKTLRGINDEIVHLLRVGQGQGFGGPAREFMDWARAQGPTVAGVLRSVSEALVHVLKAGSEVGVGLLQTIEVIAQLVSAVPPGAIAAFLQLAVVMKLVKAGALGFAAVRTVIAQVGAQLVAMRTAAAAVPGTLAGVRAGILALSRTAKVAVAGTGIGLLVIALTELSQRGRQAPPDVDKLTSSLRELASTGKVTGEAAKAFGSDLGGLYGKVRSLTDPSTTDKVQQFLVGWTGWDSTPVKEAKENIGAVDDALAGLVQSGQADLAAVALQRLTAEYGKGGRDTKEFTGQLDSYRSALADAKFEQELAAASMGIFGTQAQTVQQKLAAQKMSADGLRQSIQALSDTSRSAFDAQTKLESAIDNVTKSIKDNGKTLDVGTEKGRANRDALSQLASATDDAAAKARENGASWQTVAGIYEKGRKKLVESAEAITGNRDEAKALASELMKMPSPKMRLEMRTEDATRNLTSVIAAMKKAPDGKTVKVKALTSDAVSLLRDLGFTVTKLKDGRFKVVAETANAKANIAAVRAARDGLKDKSIDLAARDRASAAVRAIQRAIAGLRNKTVTITTVRATVATYSQSTRPVTGQGGVSKYAGGGTPEAGEMAMVGENGPELVVFGEAAKVFDSTTTRSMMRGTVGAGRAAAAGLIAGLSSTGGVYAAARFMAAAVPAGIRDEMEIASPSKKTAALAKDIGKGLIVGMTSTRDKIKATAADLAKDIKAAFSGKKEASLLKYLDQQTKKMLVLAAKRDAIAARIAEAKTFASDITKNAREGAGLGALGMDAEQVTAGGIKAGLAEKLAKIQQFTRYIGILAKKGLNKSLLREILNMGPESGYAYASALVGADKATFASINSIETQINQGTDKLGKLGADAMYDSGKNAAKGFLTGLTSQEKEVEKAMKKLATVMQNAFREAMDMRSPARRVRPDGINVARGVALGVLDGVPYAEQAMDTLSGRMAGRAAIAPTAGRAAVLGGAGQRVMQVHVEVHDAMDPVAVGREMQRVLVEFGRVQGATVQLKVGG